MLQETNIMDNKSPNFTCVLCGKELSGKTRAFLTGLIHERCYRTMGVSDFVKIGSAIEKVYTDEELAEIDFKYNDDWD